MAGALRHALMRALMRVMGALLQSSRRYDTLRRAYRWDWYSLLHSATGTRGVQAIAVCHSTVTRAVHVGGERRTRAAGPSGKALCTRVVSGTMGVRAFSDGRLRFTSLTCARVGGVSEDVGWARYRNSQFTTRTPLAP